VYARFPSFLNPSDVDYLLKVEAKRASKISSPASLNSAFIHIVFLPMGSRILPLLHYILAWPRLVNSMSRDRKTRRKYFRQTPPHLPSRLVSLFSPLQLTRPFSRLLPLSRVSLTPRQKVEPQKRSQRIGLCERWKEDPGSLSLYRAR